MRGNKPFFLLYFVFGVLIVLLIHGQSIADDPNDPGNADTLYFSCGSDSSSDCDTLYIPCNGTHDVKIKINFWNDDSITAITVPLIDSCYGPTSYAYMDTGKNTEDSAFAGSRVENWEVLVVNIDDDNHQVSYSAVKMMVAPAAPGNGLFATMVYTVKDTGRICLDTLFFPPANILAFVDTGVAPLAYTPIFRAETFIVAARTANDFPTLTMPSNVDTALTMLQTLCIKGIGANDPNSGDTIILEKIEGLGTFNPDTAFSPPTITNDSVCFDPLSVADTTYWFVFRVEDQCPAEVYDSFSVRVQLGNPPDLTIPDDVDTFLCQAQNLCIYGISATDVDANDTLILEKIEGPGTFVPDTGVSPLSDSVCFTPESWDSTYRFIFKVTDKTQFFDQDTFYVSVDVEEPPTLTLPSDVDTCLPPDQNLCVKYITATDPDTADTIVLEMVSGPGTFVPDTGLSSLSDSLCFDVGSSDSTYELVFKVTDSCDSTRQDTFYVTVNVNQPPVLLLPADLDTFLCDPQEICIDSIIAYDPDSADTFIVQMIEGSGVFDPDTGVAPDSIDTTHCFTPAGKDSTYRFVFKVTDPCGEEDVDTFNVAVDVNEPPLIFAPDTLWVINNSTKKDTFTAADPDSNTILDSAGVTVDPDCGIYSVTRISGSGGASGEWEVSFNDTGCVDSVFAMIVDLRDTVASCTTAKVGYDTVTVIIRSETHFNNPPIVFVPGDTSGYPNDTLDLIFTAADPDSDIILDTSVVFVKPAPCGSTATVRLTPSGQPSGEWRVTFYTEGCLEGTYWIDLNLKDFLGAWGWDSARVTLQTTDVPETSSTVLTSFHLEQNYPNPFNQKTSLSFQIPHKCEVSLKIYNLTGQLVKTLVDDRMDKGEYTFFWDGTTSQGQEVASGIYFYKLKASDFVSVRKMILLK
jgi:hypothetical protein